MKGGKKACTGPRGDPIATIRRRSRALVAERGGYMCGHPCSGASAGAAELALLSLAATSPTQRFPTDSSLPRVANRYVFKASAVESRWEAVEPTLYAIADSWDLSGVTLTA